MGSLEIFKTMQLDLGFDLEFRMSGSLQAIQDETQYEFIRDRILSHRSQGYQVELLSPREARAIEPGLNPNLPGYMYSPLRAQANPVKATQSFATAAERLGARVLTGCEVVSISTMPDDSYRVTTPTGEFLTGKLALAAGAWCGPQGAMLGLDIPVVPVLRTDVGHRSLTAPGLLHNLIIRICAILEQATFRECRWTTGAYSPGANTPHPSPLWPSDARW